MRIGLHVKYPLLLLYFNETLIFSTDFRNILKYQISLKNPLSGSRDVPCGQTDVTKLIVAFRSSVDKKCTYIAPGGHAAGGAVGRGTALQAVRSRVRFPMVPLEIFH